MNNIKTFKHIICILGAIVCLCELPSSVQAQQYDARYYYMHLGDSGYMFQPLSPITSYWLLGGAKMALFGSGNIYTLPGNRTAHIYGIAFTYDELWLPKDGEAYLYLHNLINNVPYLVDSVRFDTLIPSRYFCYLKSPNKQCAPRPVVEAFFQHGYDVRDTILVSFGNPKANEFDFWIKYNHQGLNNCGYSPYMFWCYDYYTGQLLANINPTPMYSMLGPCFPITDSSYRYIHYNEAFCPTVIDVRITNQGFKSFSLSWTDTGDRERFEVAIEPADSTMDSSRYVITSGSVLNYVDSTLLPDVTYNVRVRAICPGDNYYSTWSETVEYQYTVDSLSLKSSKPLWGTVEGAGTFLHGSQVTFEAIPANTDFYFDHWNDGDMWNPRTITLTQDTSFIAFFKTDFINIQSPDTTTLSLYPNPATNELILSLSGLQNCRTITMVNLLGQTVLTQAISSNTLNLDVSNLERGVYLIKLESPNGILVKKVILH